MTNPASVMVPLDLVKRIDDWAQRMGEGGESVQIRAELAALLPKPDRAEDLWNEASSTATEEEAIAVIRAELDAPREATPEVAAAYRALAETQWMLETIARSRSTNFSEVHERIIANRPVLASQFEVRHGR